MPKTRDRLLNALAWAWRKAENHFLETQDVSWKDTIKEVQDSCKLTKGEERGLVDYLHSTGL